MAAGLYRSSRDVATITAQLKKLNQVAGFALNVLAVWPPARELFGEVGKAPGAQPTLHTHVYLSRKIRWIGELLAVFRLCQDLSVGERSREVGMRPSLPLLSALSFALPCPRPLPTLSVWPGCWPRDKGFFFVTDVAATHQAAAHAILLVVA